MNAAIHQAAVDQAIAATARVKAAGPKPKGLMMSDEQKLKVAEIRSLAAQEQAAWLVAAKSQLGLWITERWNDLSDIERADLTSREEALAEKGHAEPSRYLASICGVEI